MSPSLMAHGLDTSMALRSFHDKRFASNGSGTGITVHVILAIIGCVAGLIVLSLLGGCMCFVLRNRLSNKQQAGRQMQMATSYNHADDAGQGSLDEMENGRHIKRDGEGPASETHSGDISLAQSKVRTLEIHEKPTSSSGTTL
ncbi:hypothetical protein ACJ41O_009633 [Fusarium nematophilum]